MTSGEVAKLLGLSEDRVRRAAPMYARKVGRNWWWTESAIRKLEGRKGMRGHRLKEGKTKIDI